jgi:hypothetical protein
VLRASRLAILGELLELLGAGLTTAGQRKAGISDEKPCLSTWKARLSHCALVVLLGRIFFPNLESSREWHSSGWHLFECDGQESFFQNIWNG